MIYNNVLEAVGNTPLIKLSKIVPEGYADILVKYEGVNTNCVEKINERKKRKFYWSQPEGDDLRDSLLESSEDALLTVYTIQIYTSKARSGL